MTDIEVSVDDIANMLKYPLSPVRVDGKLLCDASTMVIKCVRGHLHKLYIKDIESARGQIKCITCSTGSNFVMMTREIVENTLEAPFVLSNRKLDYDVKAVEFINPLLKICIVCTPVRGDDSISTVGEFTVIKFRQTESAARVKNTFLNALKTIKNLPQPYSENIKSLLHANNVYKQVRKYSNFKREPLPYIEMGEKLTIDNIDNFCLENCGQL